VGRRSCPAPIQDVMISCDDEQRDPSINIPNDEVKRLSLARAKRYSHCQSVYSRIWSVPYLTDLLQPHKPLPSTCTPVLDRFGLFLALGAVQSLSSASGYASPT
jgi:hypothetical protein